MSLIGSDPERIGPDVGGGNLLVLLLPIIAVYGIAFFYLLLDRIPFRIKLTRGMAIGGFVLLNASPMIFTLLPPRVGMFPYPPYISPVVRAVSAQFEPDSLASAICPGPSLGTGNGGPCGSPRASTISTRSTISSRRGASSTCSSRRISSTRDHKRKLARASTKDGRRSSAAKFRRVSPQSLQPVAAGQRAGPSRRPRPLGQPEERRHRAGKQYVHRPRPDECPGETDAAPPTH